jgi:hypothetical protein
MFEALDFFAQGHASDLLKRHPNLQIFIDQRQYLRLGPNIPATSRTFPYALGCRHGAMHIGSMRGGFCEPKVVISIDLGLQEELQVMYKLD